MAEHSYGTHENIVFRILSAIGIVCVVMGHLGCKLLGVDSWLPYYSFHMPLFSFISGYFYNEKYDREPLNWLLKKIKTVLVPFYFWAFIYLLIQTWLRHQFGVTLGLPFSIYNWIMAPWVKTQVVGFYIATWYMLALFIEEVVYVLIRWMGKNCNNKRYEDTILLCIFLIQAVVIILVNKNIQEQWCKVWLRSFFLILFFHSGYFYRIYFNDNERKHLKLLLPVGLGIRTYLMIKYGNCEFDVWNCEFNYSWWIVLFMSYTGIIFWLSIAKWMVPIVSANGIVVFLGRHTREIMTHHLFAYFMIKGIIGYTQRFFNLNSKFDFALYKKEIYYHYLPAGIQLLYVILTLLLVCAWIKMVKKGRNIISNYKGTLFNG